MTKSAASKWDNVVKLATAPPGKKMNEAHLEQGTVLDALFFELRA